jgi:AmmeMemoRadiSam system protein A
VAVRPALPDAGTGANLLRLATGALVSHLTRRPFVVRPPGLVELGRPGAAFVTLEAGGALRGCVGTIEATRPLWRDVVRNAVCAADDPRLPPVTATEWTHLDLKVSVLSRLAPLPAPDPAVLMAQLRPGLDGLLLTDGMRRATFLPAVWLKIVEPERFVAALLAKGGWAAGRWPERMVAHRYTTVEFTDPAPRRALPA